jgi:hypothetical protein
MKLLMILFLAYATQVLALSPGNPAPAFTLQNQEGKPVSLADFKGKTVVLEWLNHGCPFVRKHYDSGNMQALQKKYTAQNVIWLSVVSSAPGKQGYVDSEGAKSEKSNYGSLAQHILLDPTGQVGALYEAKTTPHMYVINQQGILVYQGAIDDIPDAKPESVTKAKNHVAAALDELKSGKAVTVQNTKAYGCSIKY